VVTWLGQQAGWRVAFLAVAGLGLPHPHPQPGQCIAEPRGQPGGISQVGQQPGAGVPDETPTISSGNNLRT